MSKHYCYICRSNVVSNNWFKISKKRKTVWDDQLNTPNYPLPLGGLVCQIHGDFRISLNLFPLMDGEAWERPTRSIRVKRAASRNNSRRMAPLIGKMTFKMLKQFMDTVGAQYGVSTVEQLLIKLQSGALYLTEPPQIIRKPFGELSSNTGMFFFFGFIF